MSNIHALADDLMPFGGVGTFKGLGALRNGASAALTSVRGSIERRKTQRYLARLSDHLLRDFGFERDWDGTIRSLRDGD